MARHACIENNIVVRIVEIENEAQYQDLARQYLLVLNVEDVVPNPQLNWIFDGVSFSIPNADNLSAEAFDRFQQTTQRQFGQKLLPDLIDKMGSRNLQLAREHGNIDVAAIAGQMASIKLLLETGALRTARTICLAILPAFPSHADILQYGADKIVEFLDANGF